MEANHFVSAQIKTVEVMKSLPITVASDIANQVKIEKDKIKLKEMNNER